MQQQKSQTLLKTFKGDLDTFISKLKERDNFTFSRFSDGELYILNKGITCRCCGGDENFDWQVEFMGEGEHNLSWANLWVNANYKYFVEEFIPILQDRKIILVSHEDADLEKAPFPIVKHFPIGRNCLVNNYSIIKEMKEYVTQNSIKNHVFLFSAASLSNILCHQLSVHAPENTYIDIGTTLHGYLGFELQRAYLQGYWLRQPNEFSEKVCIW